jgi:hypothetical protein
MTDPFRPDDELVSAVLDGEATAEERARVEADPVLSARLEEFAAVRDQVAEPVQPWSGADRERAIAAAKAAVRHHRAEPVGTVRPLRRRQGEVPRFLAVAAAVLFVLLGIGFVASQTGGDDAGDDSASSDEAAGGESQEDSAGDTAALEGGAGAGDDAGVADSPDNLLAATVDGTDFGPVADEDELRGLIVDAGGFSTDSSASASTTPPETAAVPQSDEEANGRSEDCQTGLVESDTSLRGLLAQGSADFAGTPAVVYVYGTPDGRQRVVVVSVDGCRTLAVFDL